VTNRYLLFSGEFYYARGGWHDSPRPFDDLDEATQLAERRLRMHGHEWWHVVDLQEMKIVAGSVEQAHGADRCER
jgi:hypothetical protein